MLRLHLRPANPHYHVSDIFVNVGDAIEEAQVERARGVLLLDLNFHVRRSVSLYVEEFVSEESSGVEVIGSGACDAGAQGNKVFEMLTGSGGGEGGGGGSSE